MALTTLGFTGSIDNVGWARMSRFLGSDYAVGGANDFRVETVVGQDRTVRILPGSAFGYGVLVDSDTNETVQLPTIASGSRYDLIVLRRNWAGAGTVSLVSVQGGSSPESAYAGVEDDPGVLDDQVLARVRVTAGNTLPTEIKDFRTWPSKVVQVKDLDAIQDYEVGTVADLDGRLYRLTADGLNQWQAPPTSAGRTNRVSGQSSDLVNGNVFTTVVTHSADFPPGQYLINFQVSAAKAEAGQAILTLRVPGMIDTPVSVNGVDRQVFSVTSLVSHPGGTLNVPCQINPSAGGRVFTQGTHVIVTRAG